METIRKLSEARSNRVTNTGSIFSIEVGAGAASYGSIRPKSTSGETADKSESACVPVISSDSKYTAEYDPYMYGKESQPTSFWGTVFHIFIISAGPGAFTLPATFLHVDYIIAFFGTFFIVYLYVYNLHMFVCSEYDICKRRKVPNLSYSDTVYYAFKDGPAVLRDFALPCRYVISVVFVVIWVGNNAYNLILIGDFLRGGLSMWYREDVSLRVAMIFMFIPLLLISWIPNLKYLIPLSTVGNIMNFFVLTYVIMFIIDDPKTLGLPRAHYSVTNLSIFLGAILFCINATGIIMPLKNDMRHPSKFNSSRGVLSISFLFMPVMFIFFCFLCVRKFGDDLNLYDCVVLNLPTDDMMARIVFFVFAIAICFSFPLTSYVAVDIVWTILLKQTSNKLRYKQFWEYVVRTAIFLIIYALALAVPNVSVFLSATGTIATPIDSMIFPAAVNTLEEWRKRHENPKRFVFISIRNGSIGAFALTLIALGIFNCISQLGSTYKS